MAVKKVDSIEAWEQRRPGSSEIFSEVKKASEDKGEPVGLAFLPHGPVWYYKGVFYKVIGKYSYSYTDEEKKLLVMDEYDKARRRFERLKKKFGTPESRELSRSRPRIPEQVRIEVLLSFVYSGTSAGLS